MLYDEWLSRYGLLENFNASVTRTRTGTRKGMGTGTWTTGVTAIALCTSCSRAKNGTNSTIGRFTDFTIGSTPNVAHIDQYTSLVFVFLMYFIYNIYICLYDKSIAYVQNSRYIFRLAILVELPTLYSVRTICCRMLVILIPLVPMALPMVPLENLERNLSTNGTIFTIGKKLRAHTLL